MGILSPAVTELVDTCGKTHTHGPRGGTQGTGRRDKGTNANGSWDSSKRNDIPVSGMHGERKGQNSAGEILEEGFPPKLKEMGPRTRKLKEFPEKSVQT